MKLLLDTHIWLWSLEHSPRLSKRVLAALRDPDNEVWLSPVSIWETLLLARGKRVTILGDPAVTLRAALQASSVREAPLTFEVAARSVALNLATRDPADRFIAASAAVHGLTLVTADGHLAKTKEYDVLAN